MYCPKCGQEQFCPCKACKERHKERDVWLWDKSGNAIICCQCGLTKDASWWENLELECYEEEMKKRKEYK